ncbi:putative 39S ribosomal protein L45 isoform 2 [Schistosoma japonicum]|uniref:Large ribosomal subunit protein mL45 n=2 Tax=Schistosoma japonicum TaxID=6182 RepID=A0A4Z2CVA6_SCHJA|nr:putative 39S ribosomal protein L45 isoform 2 [Schistosoma japonicum]TNN08180.1 putative 39S ribosomal protein L45 isoform 2 [Schistosoma japonicum]
MWWRGLTVFSQKYSFELRSNVRYIRHKPWVPKFRLIRQMQPWESPVDLSANKLNENESTSDLRRRLRRNGMLPPLLFYDRPINIGHTGQIFDPYVPPDGDGQTSLLSPKRLTHLKDELVDKGKNYKDLLLIRSHEPSFKSKPFASEAENIYIEAHNLLQNYRQNESRLFELVTEKALVDMTADLRLRTLRWKFVGNIEPPKVVHIRCKEYLSKGNHYAQVTVRFYTQQILSIYNRFGRLLYGNPDTAVDVLEYVVFEKHISDEYGTWRLHCKVAPPNSSANYTYVPTQRLFPVDSSSTPESNDLIDNKDIVHNPTSVSSPSKSNIN